MPDMPDPVSECPIFGRMKDKSKDPANVYAALQALKATKNFIQVGKAFGVISDDTRWSCDCEGQVHLDMTEEQWLQKFWVGENSADLWWDDFQPIEPAILRGLWRALKMSQKCVDQTGQPCPIVGVWICLGEQFEVNVSFQKLPAPHITFAILTPPPECGCAQVGKLLFAAEEVVQVAK